MPKQASDRFNRLRDDDKELLFQRLKGLRDKLLDLSNRNRLLSFKHSERSRTHIRLIDELPDVLFAKLKDGQKLRFKALPEPDSKPLYQRSKRMTVVSPIAQSDGHDSPRLVDEVVPSFAGGIEEVLVGLEDAIGEVGLSQELPDVFDGVQLGRSGRQEEQGDILGALEFASGVPAGAVEQEEGMGTGRDLAGNLAQVGLHGMGIGPGQGKRCPSAARGADGAEEVEALIALVLGLVRPCAFLGPLPHQAVLLAQAHLVLPPKLDRRPGRQMADCGG